MNIQPISNSVIMQGKSPGMKPSLLNRCKQAMLDLFSSATFKDDKLTVRKMQRKDSKLSNPAINRAVMGATAILLQPPIDYFNKSVDEETRRISVCRTTAKIVAGTSVGIIVRGGAHKMIEKMTSLEKKGKYSRALIPKDFIKTFKKDTVRLNNYRSALSTACAILVMCFTNFLIDAPLTVKLTNNFSKLTAKNDSKLNKNSEVNYE